MFNFVLKALFPSLVQNVALIPYVTIATAICQIVLGLVFVFVWDKVCLGLLFLFFLFCLLFQKLHVAIWASLHSAVLVTAMILAACVVYNVVVGDSRIIVFYVIAGDLIVGCFLFFCGGI